MDKFNIELLISRASIIILIVIIKELPCLLFKFCIIHQYIFIKAAHVIDQFMSLKAHRYNSLHNET